jgi:dimethylamine monooxygenase subunit A
VCLRIDEHYDHEVALRNRLIDEQRGTVLALAPHMRPAGEELRGLVDSFLLRQGRPPTDAATEPLEAAGRVVQEDLCLLARRDGGWHLDAAVLCFPSLWSLPAKHGRRIDGVHDLVPHYDTDLADRIDRFFDRLAPGRAVWRRNLSIKPYALLFLPVAKSDALPAGTPAAPDGTPYWLRSEFQTLQRLPESDAILFTIKTQLAPLGVLRARPDLAAALVEQLDSWSEAFHGYKTSGAALRAHVVPWLRAVAAP